MNRQSASTATLSGTGGGARTAGFERISASMYYNPANDEPFTGTVVMRADSLSSDDTVLQGQLEAWLEPGSYPAFIFQSTGSAQSADGFLVEGNLFVRDQVVAVRSHWKVLQPVEIGEDLRKNAELSATISATVPAAALLILVAAAVAPACSRSRPPSVVLIVVDTLRADHLGVYGYDRPVSPHLDALAEGAAAADNSPTNSPTPTERRSTPWRVAR